ncbi:Plant intracellular Ras-group-related LRR protein 6 [Linum grandiflorum]
MMYEQPLPAAQQSPAVIPPAANLEKQLVSTNDDAEERLEIVDLSGMSFDTLPDPPLNLACICKLDLSNNNLQSIPESLTARLLNVVVLDLHSNQLKSLPNSVGCLSKLKVLNVAGNLLVYLPKTIENCRSLEDLNINFNKLTRLPESMGYELFNLKKLSMNSNFLDFLPASITHLTSLRTLDARLNQLRSLPEDIDNLIHLQVLNVSQNFHFLQTLPHAVGLLISLEELDVSYNKIRTLPDSIGGLRKLRKLAVEGNPLASPLAEVVEHGVHAVKEYLAGRKMMMMNGGGGGGGGEDVGYRKKRSSWVGKLVKCGTFSGGNVRSEEREGFIDVAANYRSIDALASPRHVAVFSPRRMFSHRNVFIGR